MLSPLILVSTLFAPRYALSTHSILQYLLTLSFATQITCVEDKTFSTEYHDPEKRYIGNALTVTLNDGTVLDEVHIDYPVGHKRRREEGTPLLNAKVRFVGEPERKRRRWLTMTCCATEQFKNHIEPHFSADHVAK